MVLPPFERNYTLKIILNSKGTLFRKMTIILKILFILKGHVFLFFLYKRRDIYYQRDHALKIILNFEGTYIWKRTMILRILLIPKGGSGSEIHQAERGRREKR